MPEKIDTNLSNELSVSTAAVVFFAQCASPSCKEEPVGIIEERSRSRAVASKGESDIRTLDGVGHSGAGDLRIAEADYLGNKDSISRVASRSDSRPGLDLIRGQLRRNIARRRCNTNDGTSAVG